MSESSEVECKLWGEEKPDEGRYIIVFYPGDPEPYMRHREIVETPDDAWWCYAPIHPERRKS